MFDKLFHKVLKIPYSLNVEVFQAPKRPRDTYVLVHGIGNTLHSWDEVVKQMPKDVRIIGVDLLGFGKSPKPSWLVYDAKTQARSVGATLLRKGLLQQPVLIGHSLGALVSVEIARRYPFAVKQLVLAGPPFYKPESEMKKNSLAADVGLRDLYRVAKKHPEVLSALSPYAVKWGLANKSLNITDENVSSYVAALEASIINQTALADIQKLTLPIHIVYGSLDPVIIGKHISNLAKQQPNITAKRLLVGHEIIGVYVKSFAGEVEKAVNGSSKRR